jgi:hypothetical protein
MNDMVTRGNWKINGKPAAYPEVVSFVADMIQKQQAALKEQEKVV